MENLDLQLKKIAEAALEGEILLFPTETVYGIGVHVFNNEALIKLNDLKPRANKAGYIVHIADIQDAKKIAADIPNQFYLLAKHFFPGPLTIILKKRATVSDKVSINDTVAVRMPKNALALQLIKLIKDPIVGTSANLPGNAPCTTFQEAKNLFLGKISSSSMIDGGDCPVAIPSTILSLVTKPFTILRKGIMLKEELEAIVKQEIVYS